MLKGSAALFPSWVNINSQIIGLTLLKTPSALSIINLSGLDRGDRQLSCGVEIGEQSIAAKKHVPSPAVPVAFAGIAFAGTGG